MRSARAPRSSAYRSTITSRSVSRHSVRWNPRWASGGEGESVFARAGSGDGRTSHSRQPRPPHRDQQRRARRHARDDHECTADGSLRELHHPPRRHRQALRAGVRVRILYDAFGCRGTRGAYWRALRSAGVDVRPFRPIWTSGPIAAFSRDHRKLLVVDGERAMTGGLCIGDEWAGNAAEGRPCWRDTMVDVCGPAVAVLQAAFARMWARAGRSLPDDEIAPAPEECGPSAVRVVEGFPGQSR